VFDAETPDNHPNVQHAIDLARGHGVNLAISNPAFEFWFLLHFTPTARPFENAQTLIQELKQHWPSYDKSADMYRHLALNTEDAIERAEQVLSGHTDTTDCEFPNPSTTVHRLVQELLNLRRR